MLYIAKRMQARPNRVQTAVEALYALMRDNITRGNMDDAMARKWFPFIGALFLFIWFSNLIGYIPLPTNTHEKFDALRRRDPGVRALRGDGERLRPARARAAGVDLLQRRGHPRARASSATSRPDPGGRARRRWPLLIFVLEFMSNFMRLISLTVRLFANILAGHLIILFMSGGLAVLLGMEVARRLTLPFGVVALPLRGRPGRHAAGLHLRHPVCHLPRRRGRRAPLRSAPHGLPAVLPHLFAQAEDGSDAGKAIALGVGGGLGAVGAGVGIGIIFGKVIESVTRQPEMRDEITSIQWLGFALTEACFFYGLVAGLIAFFL